MSNSNTNTPATPATPAPTAINSRAILAGEMLEALPAMSEELNGFYTSACATKNDNLDQIIDEILKIEEGAQYIDNDTMQNCEDFHRSTTALFLQIDIDLHNMIEALAGAKRDKRAENRILEQAAILTVAGKIQKIRGFAAEAEVSVDDYLASVTPRMAQTINSLKGCKAYYALRDHVKYMLNTYAKQSDLTLTYAFSANKGAFFGLEFNSLSVSYTEKEIKALEVKEAAEREELALEKAAEQKIKDDEKAAADLIAADLAEIEQKEIDDQAAADLAAEKAAFIAGKAEDLQQAKLDLSNAQAEQKNANSADKSAKSAVADAVNAKTKKAANNIRAITKNAVVACKTDVTEAKAALEQAELELTAAEKDEPLPEDIKPEQVGEKTPLEIVPPLETVDTGETGETGETSDTPTGETGETKSNVKAVDLDSVNSLFTRFMDLGKTEKVSFIVQIASSTACVTQFQNAMAISYNSDCQELITTLFILENDLLRLARLPADQRNDTQQKEVDTISEKVTLAKEALDSTIAEAVSLVAYDADAALDDATDAKLDQADQA